LFAAGRHEADSAIHAPNEQIRVDDFYDVIGLHGCYLSAYGEL